MEEPAVRKTPMMRVVELENGGVPIDELMRRRLSQGCSVRQMASEFGVHFTNVYDWLETYHIPVPARAPRDYSEEAAGRATS